MVYKQGVNRVANDEVFPYSLKLWYDDENIYVKVLKIPRPEDLKENNWVKGASNHERAFGENDEGYFSNLFLCLETPSLSKGHPVGRNKYLLISDLISNPQLNRTYVFDLAELALPSLIRYLLVRKNCWAKVRATFRYGGKGLSNPERTGVHSNETKVPLLKRLFE